jgi:hypothetical protein
MIDKWISKGLYEHPAKHNAGTYGNVGQTDMGVYFLRVGNSRMSCPQDWAAKIHAEETGQLKIIRIRNIPADVHTALKKRAIDEGVSMEALVLRWIEEKLS